MRRRRFSVPRHKCNTRRLRFSVLRRKYSALRRRRSNAPPRRRLRAPRRHNQRGRVVRKEILLLTRSSWRRLLLDALLLPAALVVVVFEDVVWAGARAVLRALLRLPPFRKLQQQMGRLPGWRRCPCSWCRKAAPRR